MIKKYKHFHEQQKKQNYDSTQEIPSICFSAFFIKPVLHTPTNKIILSTLLVDTQWILLIFLNNCFVSSPLQHSH